jgi:hypothetical protein
MFDDDAGVVPSHVCAPANPNSLRSMCDNELKGYMDDSVRMPLNEDDGSYTNPLDWWKMYAGTYPVLACLAKRYLAIPATSAPSERIFSRAGRIISMRRASLSADITERMLYIKENMELLHKHYDTVAQDENRASNMIKEEKKLLTYYNTGIINKNTNPECIIEIDD